MDHIARFWLLLSLFISVQGVDAQAPARVAGSDPKKSSAAENAAMRKTWESWNAPVKPFRIIGNIYYVGAAGVSSFLITTPEGNLLIDTGFAATVPRIQESVAKLGFRIEDIKILLSSHAHLDHTGGHARMKELTGAKIMISRADAALLASGGTNDFLPDPDGMMRYPGVQADRFLPDGEEVSLGGTSLRCHLTPGHTKGCTTWTMDTVEAGRVFHVVFFGSTTVLPNVPLVNNPRYPAIAEDLRGTYRTLKTLPCDVFLAPHGGFFGLAERLERLERGETPNPFVDPAAFRQFVERAEKTFLEQMDREQKSQKQARR